MQACQSGKAASVSECKHGRLPLLRTCLSWPHGASHHQRQLPPSRLSYTTPVDAPAVLKRMIGTEAIRVTEAQSLSSDASGAIIVSSVPVPDFAGADRFVTQATTSIRDVTGGCKASPLAAGWQGAAAALQIIQFNSVPL